MNMAARNHCSRPIARGLHGHNGCPETSPKALSRLSFQVEDSEKFGLTSDVREDNPKFEVTDVAALSDVIARSSTDDFVYHRILARRFLAMRYARQERLDLACEQLEKALIEAWREGLDTEIGHLHRLFGVMLRASGQVDAACKQFEQAAVFEQVELWFNYTSYWQALSTRELGATRMRQAGRVVSIAPGKPPRTLVAFDDLKKLQPALEAYRAGRTMLNNHLTLLSPFPIARAAKQELFRSFNANAMQAAFLLQSTQDMLAEVEFSGPREATEVVTAITAARELKDASLADFRRNRAVYYRALNTMPSRFEDYIDNVTKSDAARRTYLQQTFKFTGDLLDPQMSDDIVDRILKLRIPNAIFLLFHFTDENGVAVVLDMSSGTSWPFSIASAEATGFHRVSWPRVRMARPRTRATGRPNAPDRGAFAVCRKRS